MLSLNMFHFILTNLRSRPALPKSSCSRKRTRPWSGWRPLVAPKQLQLWNSIFGNTPTTAGCTIAVDPLTGLSNTSCLVPRSFYLHTVVTMTAWWDVPKLYFEGLAIQFNPYSREVFFRLFISTFYFQNEWEPILNKISPRMINLSPTQKCLLDPRTFSQTQLWLSKPKHPYLFI